MIRANAKKAKNDTILAMQDRAGSGPRLAAMLNDACIRRGHTRRVYQSHVWRAIYTVGQFPETLILPALDVCKQLGMTEVTAHDLRPSLPKIA